MNVYDGDGKKTPNNEKTKPRKRFSQFGYPPITPVYEMEADCFPVSENTENKLNLPKGGGILA